MTVVAATPAFVEVAYPIVGVFPASFAATPAVVEIVGPSAGYSNEYSNDVTPLGTVRLDRLNAGKDKIATPEGLVTFQFQKRWQTTMEQIERTFLGIGDVVSNNAAFIKGLKEAQQAAAQATAAAAAAEARVAQQNDLQRVRDSYSDANVLSSSNVSTITVAAHQRHYLDPGSESGSVDVSLSGGTITGLTAGTLYFVYYDDPTLMGGAVTFKASTDNAQAVASLTNPYRHALGSITTPDTTTGPGTTGPSNPPPWKIEMELPLI